MLWNRYLVLRLETAVPDSGSATPTTEAGPDVEPIQLLVPNLLERMNRGELGGRVRFPFPNRVPGPGGGGMGRFGGGPFGPGRAGQGLFPPPPPRPFVPGGQFQPRRRNMQAADSSATDRFRVSEA